MIELSIRKPVTVAVGVILLLLFGGLSLLRVPVQLTPDIVQPQITVETVWRGATPHEIEREIIEEQEEQLKLVEGLDRVTSESFDDMGRIILEFPAGTDMDSAVIKVSNRLEQVPDYPADADKPVILTTNKTDNAMAWFMLYRLPGNDTEIDEYFRLCDDVIKPEFERVHGVGSANIFGGREQELQVIVEPEELAARGITMAQVLRAIDRENVNVSGGDFTEGKRSYKVRTVGEYGRPEDVGKVVLETNAGKRVYLRDVASIRVGLQKRDNFVRQRGVPTIAVNAIRRVGANVMDTVAALKEKVERLNAGELKKRRVQLVQVYDETDYIAASVYNVLRNLLLGSVLAVVVLFLFLRSFASTFIVAVAIPISVVGSFILMYFFGRSINVISLAGMSFASGMVVDNAIVSLENIFRLRQEGKGRFEAALQGTREIWGAILASTLTTVAVFVPLLFVEENAAQLFRDIAIAISCSVGLSLLVSVTVIPTLAAKLLRAAPGVAPAADAIGGAEGGSVGLFRRMRAALLALVSWVIGRLAVRIFVILFLTGSALGLAWAFLPQAEYLPEGNRNLGIGILLPPPGYSIEKLSSLGGGIEARLLPFTSADAEGAVDVAEASAPTETRVEEGGITEEGGGALPLAGRPDHFPEVEIRHFFYVARQGSVFLGAVASRPEQAGGLIPVLQYALSDIPGMISVVQQASLFERGITTGRRVDIEITGPELETLVAIGGATFGAILGRFPFSEGHQARPIPSLDLQNPEVHIVPDRERAKDLGLDAQELGITVDAIIDGAKASDYKLDGREIDLVLMGGERQGRWKTQHLENIPIYTPDGKLVSLGSVSDIRITRGPQQINHIERDRAITIQFVPSKGLPLEQAVKVIESEIVEPLRASGALPPRYSITLAGTVDDLYRAFTAFRWNFLLALLITYLLLSALFESFLYPFVVLFSVPLAAVGGVICLNLVHSFVPSVRLDILTMLGFVILVGVVVNNAILIVYQALRYVGDGEPTQDAVVRAVASRIRPIFMTTLTSGFGMLPLVLFPGSGSELYRGLGSVVVGGLVVSTVFTLFLIPALLRTVLEIQVRLGRLPAAKASEGTV